MCFFNKIRKLKSPILAVDGLLVKGDKVLLVRRNIEPFQGCWVLPGGHVRYGEKVEEAIKREMKEELGLEVKVRKLLGVYSDPKRDPRYHVVSLAFLLNRNKGEIRLNEEASEFKYFSLNRLPSKIGFDHHQIINDFKQQKNVRRI